MASFDRKIERNRIRMNKKGKGSSTQGQGTVSGRTAGPNGDGDVFKGRKILLPVLLVALALTYGSIGFIGGAPEADSFMYWITIGLYVLLALIIFLKKPFLRISKNSLFTQKYNRDRRLDAGQISKIKISPTKITIVPKSGEPNWVFYKTRNRFDTEAMGNRLAQYANAYHVTLEQE